MNQVKQLLRARSTWIVLAATLLCVLLVLYAWRLPPFRSGVESTEDAFVKGMVTVVAPKVDGYVAEVLVQDYMPVKAGDVLVKIDDRIYRQKLDQARSNLAVQEANLANGVQTRKSREASIGSADAQIANAQAQLAKAKADLNRAVPLARNGALSQKELDQTQAALRQAEATVKQAQAGKAVANQDLQTVVVNRDALQAAVEAARAAVELAQIDLDNTEIRAPRDGHVGEVGVKLGQYVTPGTQLMSVVPDQVWVVANFKEAQTAYMKPGQTARFKVDGLANAELTGHVERISPATGSEFSVIKQDNATGNFTKIPQRLTVRIAIDPDQKLTSQLRPGMSVVVQVNTHSKAESVSTSP